MEGVSVDKTGSFTQQENQDEATRSVDLLFARKRQGIIVGLIIGLSSFTMHDLCLAKSNYTQEMR